MSRRKLQFIGTFFKGLGSRLKNVRGGLSQEGFGKLFGVRKSTVSRWEAELLIPDEETLKKIANYGKVGIDWLLRGDLRPSSAPQLRDFGQEEYISSLNPLETALLIEVVKVVEAVILKRQLQLTLDQKARLFVRTYDDCRAQQLPPTPHHVEKLLYLVD